MDLTIQNDNWDMLDQSQKREKISEFEAACLEEAESSSVELAITSHFCEGVYAREMFIPKGVSLVGGIHIKPNINIVSKGKIVVVTEFGKKVVTAPATFVSPAGTKRIGYALEDTIWTAIHATTLTDPEEIRREVIAPDYNTLDRLLEETKHGLGSSSNNSSIEGEYGAKEIK